ncbi:Fic family protein [Candidatus Oleimmundimicrobium sp.]|uniref:Fic family protein n=1 Tax=Candidatus Oleimmundimicrobium sp. TaxID=3060597 RepID=UPI002716E576|nr:Fic family protein [Candidatus Oleimmundimicrobium sp.]MDO8885970.1 Fic family protein [Candidatus Oleimmundimicrobium sp.]
MFKPKFRYTDKIVHDLTQIAAARELVLNSPFIPKWEVSLRREAIIRCAHSSTAIEGNRLSLEQVSDLVNGREVMATRKDKQEVLNYLGVLENIQKLTDGKNITEENVLKIHKILTQDTLENPSDCGVYRTRYVVVGNRLTGEVSFRPPSNEDVPSLIKALIEWLDSPKAKTLDPVLEAGIAHYEFVRIHPFVDGNGRTARVLAALVLYLQGFDAKQFFCLDDYYDSDRQSYYGALQSVDQTILDLTGWLEYFVEGVKVSIAAVRERVARLSAERLKRTEKGQIALTERQMRIIEFINQNGKITNRDVREMFKISDRAALKEIRKLVDLKVIKSEGKGRSLSYVLAQ